MQAIINSFRCRGKVDRVAAANGSGLVGDLDLNRRRLISWLQQHKGDAPRDGGEVVYCSSCSCEKASIWETAGADELILMISDCGEVAANAWCLMPMLEFLGLSVPTVDASCTAPTASLTSSPTLTC